MAEGAGAACQQVDYRCEPNGWQVATAVLVFLLVATVAAWYAALLARAAADHRTLPYAQYRESPAARLPLPGFPFCVRQPAAAAQLRATLIAPPPPHPRPAGLSWMYCRIMASLAAWALSMHACTHA